MFKQIILFNRYSRVKANIITIKEETLEECKEKLEELPAYFKHRFKDLKSLKFTFAYFVSPFICDII